MSEFKLDDITTDSDLSLLDKKFERGGDIYTAVMDTALGAMQRFGEIQEQKRIALRQEEEYKIDVINSVNYDASDPNDVARAKERLERIAKSDMTKADAMPYYAEQLKNKHAKLTRDEENLKELDKSIRLFQNPRFEDADGNMRDYNFDAFVEGGFYDRQGITGNDLEDKIDEAIEYNTVLINKIVKLGGDEGGHFGREAQQKITDLENIKAYIGNTGTFTQDEKELMNQGVSLRKAFADADAQYQSSYQQIRVLQDEIDSIQPDPDSEGNIELTSEKQQRLQELEVARDEQYRIMGIAKQNADNYYNEFAADGGTGRLLPGFGKDETEQSNVVINNTDNGKVTISSKITIDDEEFNGRDIHHNMLRLERIANKSPRNIESSQYYGMYESLLNIDPSSPLMDMEVGDRTVKDIVNVIKSKHKEYKDSQNLAFDNKIDETNIVRDVLDINLLDNLDEKVAKRVSKPLESFNNLLKTTFGDDMTIDDFPPIVASYIEKSLKGLPFTPEESASLFKYLQSDTAKMNMTEEGKKMSTKKLLKKLTRNMDIIGTSYRKVAPEEVDETPPPKEMDFRRDMLQGIRN